MKRVLITIAGCLLWAGTAFAINIDLSHGDWKIALQPGATTVESSAAQGLSTYLERCTGKKFEITQSNTPSERVIIVGQGESAKRLFPEIDLSSFGEEEIIIAAHPDALLVSGGRPRGVSYAVSYFLQKHCGVRWWTPWAESVPSRPD